MTATGGNGSTDYTRSQTGTNGSIVTAVANASTGNSSGTTAESHTSTVSERAVLALDRLLWEEKAAGVRALLRRLDADGYRGAVRDAVMAGNRAKLQELAGQAAALIHASNGAADGIRKLNGKLAARMQVNTADSTDLPIVSALSTDELDLALGRANVVHAALLAGPASKTFLMRCQTLSRFRITAGSKMTGTDKDLGPR